MKHNKKIIAALSAMAMVMNMGTVFVNAEETIHLNLLHHLNEQGKKDGLVALSEAFNEKYPNIVIDVEFLSQTDYANTLKQRAAADNMPDFINYRPKQEPTLIEAGLIEALEADLYPDEVDKSLVDSVSLDGVCYGVPLDRGGYGLYYNETILKEVGATPEDLTTISGLLDTCSKLKEAGITPLASGYADTWTEAVMLESSVVCGLQTEYPTMATDLMSGTKKFADFSELAGILDNLLTLTREYALVDAKSASQTASDQYAQFGRGDAAMMIQGSWAISDIYLAKEAVGNDDEMGFTAFPWCDDPEKNCMGANADDTLMIASGSKHKEEAILFLEFCMTAEAAEIWMQHSNTITSRSDVAPFVDNELTKDVKETLDNSAYYYEQDGIFSGQQYNEYTRLFTEGRASGLNGEEIVASLDEAFANIFATQ